MKTKILMLLMLTFLSVTYSQNPCNLITYENTISYLNEPLKNKMIFEVVNNDNDGEIDFKITFLDDQGNNISLNLSNIQNRTDINVIPNGSCPKAIPPAMANPSPKQIIFTMNDGTTYNFNLQKKGKTTYKVKEDEVCKILNALRHLHDIMNGNKDFTNFFN